MFADNSNAAAGDLSVPGADPVPATPDTPPMSFAEAESRKTELINDADFRTLLFNGDIGAKQEWDRVVSALSRPPETPTGPREAAADHLNASNH